MALKLTTLLAHEVGHDEPDEGHHPWWHFCLRSPLAIRPRWVHSRVTKTDAIEVRGNA